MGTQTAEVTTVETAVRDFAQILAETAVFQRFEQASERMQADAAAQTAMNAFQQKQQSLQALLMLNAVSSADRSELQRLQEAFFNQSTVTALLEAQDDLRAVCQMVSGILSDRIGLPFAAACGPGCSC
ncbi:MAG: YlbF family regulator [Anaerolinea sp.]|nr:YlbF family regulator [Anaerolinea sp.]